jgi:basic amino acid/polyamine antiporter, APA family
VTTLERRLGLGDAVVVGLGAMVGAGVFAAFAPATRAAGGLLLVALAVAAVVATCNALSSAQLAAVHPEAGGSYVYGRRQLGPFWGYLAGSGFVVGKTASCAAMALTVGQYVAPGQARAVAVAAVVGLAAVTYRGVTRGVALTRALLAVVLAVLALVVVAGLTAPDADADRLLAADVGAYGVLQGAGLLFFAFAGYARLATMGEEVRDPERTIPRAIPLALGLVLALYAAVAAAALVALGPDRLAAASAPLAEVVETSRLDGLAPAVRVGAALAALGVLLSLLLGVSRTVLAMARERELPGWLDAVHPATRVPHHAELAVAAVVVAVVLVADLRGAIGFSSFAVLTYYAVTNASALTLPADRRRYPRGVAVLGLAGCAVLALSLPAPSVVGGLVVLAGCSLAWPLARRRAAR